MKLKKIARLQPALLAVGVFLGRGAHADTTLTFDAPASGCTPPQINNPNSPPGITNFGNFAAGSSVGVAVTGFGTPNIGLAWGSDNFPTTRWEYYNGGPWNAAQLQANTVGTAEELVFIPNNPSASVEIESFNFFPYYNAVDDVNAYGGLERYTFNVSVLSGKTVLSGPTMFTFTADGTKHPVVINYTGAPGQTLKLKLAAVKATLGAGEIQQTGYSLAVDDIAFAQTPATTFPAGPQVVSVTPADGTSGLPATSSPPYSAIISNGPTLSVANPIQLKLDGGLVSPPPTITSLGSGQTSVIYPGASSLLSSDLHVYTLTYADNLGGVYTNEVVFSTPYTILPPTYALPPGSGIIRGLTWRTVSASTEGTNLDSTISRAIAQLNGTLINTNTGLPYTNSATLGTNADGSFNIDGDISFVDNGPNPPDFPTVTTFPGLDTIPNYWFSCEGRLFLDLPVGYYRLGVNSDDGFEVNALPPEGTPGSPIVVGVFDAGRGADNSFFDVLVQSSGVYPFQLIYFQDAGYANVQFFSVTNLNTGGFALINDPADGNAIPSYRVLRPHLTRILPSGANVVLNWAYGNPPFQVQFKTNVTDAVWNNVGGTTTSRTATVPALPDTGFYRVFGQ
jgi:hypothetical protein